MFVARCRRDDPVAPGEELIDRLLDAFAGDERVFVVATSGEEVRRLTTSGSLGEVTLAIGSEMSAGDGWRAPLDELTALLREQADALVYASIRRGSLISGTDGVGADWPRRPADRPRGPYFTADAFDDVFAPDAFGVQLLGPGYADRLPVGSAWSTERVGRASVLVQHRDPDAWFARRSAGADGPGPGARRPRLDPLRAGRAHPCRDRRGGGAAVPRCSP